MKELLPLGSVVTLNEGTKRLMIIGRLQRACGTEDIYDYSACIWPEGYLDSKHVYLFNQEDIRCLYYVGLQDVEEFQFRYVLEEEMNKQKAGH